MIVSGFTRAPWKHICNFINIRETQLPWDPAVCGARWACLLGFLISRWLVLCLRFSLCFAWFWRLGGWTVQNCSFWLSVIRCQHNCFQLLNATKTPVFLLCCPGTTMWPHCHTISPLKMLINVEKLVFKLLVIAVIHKGGYCMYKTISSKVNKNIKGVSFLTQSLFVMWEATLIILSETSSLFLLCGVQKNQKLSITSDCSI